MSRFLSTTSFPWVCSITLVIAVVFLATGPSLLTQAPPAAEAKLRSYAAWQKACANLPSNREVDGRYPPRAVLPIQNYDEFDDLIDAFFEQSKTGALAQRAHWLGDGPDATTFFDVSKHYYRDPGIKFAPFVQRLDLPAESTVIVHGDLHGDIRSLMHGLEQLNKQGILDGFRIADPNTHLLFLGDYCDRGIYGTEVIYTLLRLKTANPEQVWLVRGNHEEVRMIAQHGFGHEGRYKYGAAFDLFKVSRIYDLLPVALYLGCEGNYVQCNHGGMEAGYDPAGLLADLPDICYQMLGELKRADFLTAYPDILEKADQATRIKLEERYRNFTPAAPVSLDVMGFMWADFAVVPDRSLLRYDDARPGWMFGKDLTQRMLKATGPDGGPQVRAVFRAHQHSSKLNPMMRRLIAGSGLFRHWQDEDNVDLLEEIIPTLRERLESKPNRRMVEGAVYTFNVSPDSHYGKNCGFDFDTFGMVTLKKRLEDWQLQVVNPMP